MTVNSPQQKQTWPALKLPTLCAAFQHTAAQAPESIALQSVDASVQITWGEYAARVQSIARGLAAVGVSHGDHVVLMFGNSIEFSLVDAAIMHLGAVSVSIYNTYPAEDIRWVVEDTGARVMVCEPQFLDVIHASAAELLDELFVAGGDGLHEASTLADLERGSEAAADFDFEASWRAVKAEDDLTLIYTSGTTGKPKAVRYLHSTLLFPLGSLHDLAPFSPGGRVVSFLPAAHIAERYFSHYAAMVFGLTVTCCPDPRQLFEALSTTHPTRFFAPPRIYEKVCSALKSKMDETGRAALDAGLEAVRAEQADEQLSPDAAARYATADAETLSTMRTAIGLDQCEWVGVGAAPVTYDVLEFFHAIGVRIAEFWGMSECSLALANPPERIRLGRIGIPVAGVEVMLAEDGEMLVRGPNVMPGYLNNPEKTHETIDAAGWLHSGDLGTVDEEGYYTIIDRKKELIINSAGKNMSPSKIEAVLKTGSPLIGQAVCIGDGRRYNVALLVLDRDGAAAWAQANGRKDADLKTLAGDRDLQQDIAEAVSQANTTLARVEHIREYRLLSVEWLPGGDELTPTSKLRRKEIERKYAATINAMFDTNNESTS